MNNHCSLRQVPPPPPYLFLSLLHLIIIVPWDKCPPPYLFLSLVLHLLIIFLGTSAPLSLAGSTLINHFSVRQVPPSPPYLFLSLLHLIIIVPWDKPPPPPFPLSLAGSPLPLSLACSTLNNHCSFRQVPPLTSFYRWFYIHLIIIPSDKCPPLTSFYRWFYTY